MRLIGLPHGADLCFVNPEGISGLTAYSGTKTLVYLIGRQDYLVVDLPLHSVATRLGFVKKGETIYEHEVY